MSNILIEGKKRNFSLIANNRPDVLSTAVDAVTGPILWDDGTNILWDDGTSIEWNGDVYPILLEARKRNFSLVTREAENV